MFFTIKDGKIYRHQSATVYTCVYNQSNKAVKVLLSPDEKKVLFLLTNGIVKCMDVMGSGNTARTVYYQSGGLSAQDIAWDGNKNFLIKNNNGWKRQSV